MGKGRMTSTDLRAAVSELSQKLVGQRLQNIYDVTPKMFLLKFAGKGGQKDFVMIEVGSRIHSTTFKFDKPKIPSAFTLRIRKHIRQWRLDSLRQLGSDRVVEFVFGTDDKAFRLIIEFYAKGNLILSDHAYNIIALTRSHATEEAKYAVRATYPTADIQLLRSTTRERVEEAFKEVEANTGSMSLKTAFTNCTEFGPALVEHCLLTAGLRPNFKKAGAAQAGRDALDILMSAFEKADMFFKEIPQTKGFLVRRLQKEEDPAAVTDASSPPIRPPATQFEDFAPMLYKQHQGEGLSIETFDSFNAACDYYFSAMDQGTIDQHNKKSEKVASTKLDRALNNHRRRISELAKEQSANQQKASLIETNTEEVDTALEIIRSALGRAMDWNELSRVIKEQKRLGNPVASIIHELKLDKNMVSLLLTGEDEEGEDVVVVVDIDIALSAHANARNYFQVKKKIQEKQSKTEAAEGKAMQSAARKAENASKKKVFAPKKDLGVVRKVLWFEKFNWFITSDNYMVLSGRDAQQNELLVKRYLKKGDIYLHGDMHGAATTIIKNPSGEGVSQDTLYQAGNMAVCRSSAWETNLVISAWWVFDHQVSKTAPTGEYLPTGSFMIRGKKNFLPPTKIQLGAAVLFRVHQENAARHKGERTNPEFIGNHDDVSEMTASVAPSVAPSICAASEAPSSIRCNKVLMDRYSLSSNVYNEDGTTIQQEEEKEKVPEPEVDKKDDDKTEERERKPRISAKERRLMKKKAQQPQQENDADSVEEGSDDADEEKTAPKKKKGEPQRPLSRAEKRKAKKASKYKEQDDDEREVRMRLCGYKGGLRAMEAEAAAAESSANPEPGPKVVQFEQDDAFKKDVRASEYKKEDHVQKEAEMEFDVLDALTGKPFEDDLILHPMVMVAPIEAVEDYKYKVNILPGKEKKGKASSAILHRFSTSIVCTEQERDLLRKLDPQEFCNLLPSNLRVLTDADVASGKTKKKRK